MPYKYLVDSIEKFYDQDELKKLIENNLPLHINYLSCDIDPTCNTFDVLKKIIKVRL